MKYYYVDDMDTSFTIIQMLQECSKFFSIPMVVNEELKQKFENLDKLCTMWTDGSIYDNSYQSDIYKQICGK